MTTVRSALRRLQEVLSRAPSGETEIGLPCAVCGGPATGWASEAWARGGIPVIEGYAACADHRDGSGQLPRSKAG